MWFATDNAGRALNKLAIVLTNDVGARVASRLLRLWSWWLCRSGRLLGLCRCLLRLARRPLLRRLSLVRLRLTTRWRVAVDVEIVLIAVARLAVLIVVTRPKTRRRIVVVLVITGIVAEMARPPPVALVVFLWIVSRRWRSTIDGGTVVTIPIRTPCPAIAVAIEIPTAVVAVPVIVEVEGDGRYSERPIILRTDIDATLLIERLHIAAGDPAATAGKGHVAPGRLGKAAIDAQRRTDWDQRHGRIGCTRT